jgi:hypothetical protein
MTFDRRPEAKTASLDPKVKQALKLTEENLKFLVVHAKNGINEIYQMDFAGPEEPRREAKLYYASRDLGKMQDLLKAVENNILEASK